MNQALDQAQGTAAAVGAYAGRDIQIARTVRQTELIAAGTVLGLAALCLLIALGTFFSQLFRNGFGSAVLNAALTLVLVAFVCMVAGRILGALVLTPYRALQYRASKKRMVAELADMGVQPAMLHQWHSPNPGVLALDARQGVLYVNARSADYQRLFLSQRDIIGVKVERESEIHTKTTHGGSLSVFSNMGLGYSFGSRSRSTSVVLERAFLEIHYQRATDPAPSWVAIPFEENRREADSMAAAIQRL